MGKKSAALKVELSAAEYEVHQLESHLKDALAAEADPKGADFSPGAVDRLREGLKQAKARKDEIWGRYMRTYD